MAEEPKPTLYDIIGVSPDATEAEIKRQYRRRAMELHPDRNPDDPLATEKFQQLSEAYEILKDPAKRETYDRFGSCGDEPTAPEDIEVFEMITQILGLGRSRGVPKGDKVSPTIRLLTVPLEKAYTGGKMTEKLSYHKICPKCSGKGSKTGMEYEVCPVCNGAGSLSPGGLQFLFPCKACDSVGYIIPKHDRCSKCGGRKLIKEKKKVEVNIECGINDEDQIVLPSQGDEFPGKAPADVVFMVQIKTPSDWIRDGDDLYYIKNLCSLERNKGTAFTIKTLDERELEVCTEEGKEPDMTKLKWIPNEGMPCKGNVQFKGNLYIIFDKGFPEPIHELCRTIANLWNRKYAAKIVLQDAPEDKQERYRQMLKEEEERREEELRMAREMLNAALGKTPAGQPQPQPQQPNQGEAQTPIRQETPQAIEQPVAQQEAPIVVEQKEQQETPKAEENQSPQAAEQPEAPKVNEQKEQQPETPQVDGQTQ